jgi:hypothetical protein
VAKVRADVSYNRHPFWFAAQTERSWATRDAEVEPFGFGPPQMNPLLPPKERYTESLKPLP